MRKGLLFIVVGFLFVSCASMRRQNSKWVLPEYKTYYFVDISEISVTIDRISDEVISKQMEDMLKASINDKYSNSGEKLFLDVEINQRKYFSGMEEINSVYVSYKLWNENQEPLLSNGFYLGTKDSIVASIKQYQIVDVITRQVNSYIRSSASFFRKKNKEI